MKLKAMNNFFKILYFKLNVKGYSSSKKRYKQFSTKEALLGCLNQLEHLKSKHCKKKYGENPEYLINWIFKPIWGIKNELEAKAYCRANLYVATDEFDKLIKKIEKTSGKLNYYSIKKYGEQIREFISDLQAIIVILENKNSLFDFILFKINYHHSFEIFQVSHALFWHPNFEDNLLDKKATLNLTVFTIRQSLEIRFRKISGVYRVFNKNNFDVKLRHDFYVEFYKKNRNLIELDSLGIKIANLFKIYKWTNATIHNGFIPKVWQVSYALSLMDNFFLPKKFTTKTKKGTSIYGAVKIKNYQRLLDLLTVDIFSKANEIFCIELDEPEAVIEEM
jgi:hypothetical protein